MIINRIYEHQNLLSLYLVSFLVGLRTYHHPCTYTYSLYTCANISVPFILHFLVLSTDVMNYKTEGLSLDILFIPRLTFKRIGYLSRNRNSMVVCDDMDGMEQEGITT